VSEDWRENPVVVELVEFALRSVIRAHPSKENEGVRLRTAMKALFAIDPGPGKPPDPDRAELLHMARGYATDRGDQYSFNSNYTPVWAEDAETDARSPTTLAKEAIAARMQSDSDYKPHNPNEKIRNLVKKFQQSRDVLLRLVVGWDSEGGADVFAQNVRGLRETLDTLGIPIANIAAPNRELNALN